MQHSGHKICAEERKTLDWIEAQNEDMIALVKAWSQINSGSTHYAGLERMRGKLEEVFADLGGDMCAAALPPNEKVESDGTVSMEERPPSFLLTKRPEAPVQILLTGHHDTVFPPSSPFQDYTLLDDDTLNGPGVADMKGGLIVMFYALMALERTSHAQNIGYRVLISPDEEIGSPGSASLLEEYGRRADLGMTYEPCLADGSLAGARKGSGNFTLVVHGKAAHAGRDHHLGRNAFQPLSFFITELQELNGKRDGVTFNTGKVEGGGPVNIVPDLAIARFNVRMPEKEDMAWIEQALTRLVSRINEREGFQASLHGGFTRPPKPMAPKNARLFSWLKEAGQALGLEIRWQDTGGVCEGNNLWAVGCPNIDTLGVRGGRIHSPEEYALLSSFVERSQLSALMLMKLASGEFDIEALKKAS